MNNQLITLECGRRSARQWQVPYREIQEPLKQKFWNGLCRRANEISHGRTPAHRGKHWKSKKTARTSDTCESTTDNCSEDDSPDKRVSGGAYKQATVFVAHSTDVKGLVEEYFPDTPCTGVTLAGLHTCGNLAPTCLQLFVKNKDIKLLCNVGCCYHLIEEQFSRNPFSVLGSEMEYGFPMSHYLTSQNFSLGRNARMLAAQSLDRISEKERVPVQSLFYRALLQVLLIQRCGQELPSWQVGRIASKCKDFTEYVTKAVKKLNLDIQPTTAEIDALYESYLHKQEELELFFLLRVALAPVIETVVLLDRLLYLHEHGMCEAYLVQLFDPLVSPRCYGIVAVKSQYFVSP